MGCQALGLTAKWLIMWLSCCLFTFDLLHRLSHVPCVIVQRDDEPAPFLCPYGVGAGARGAVAAGVGLRAGGVHSPSGVRSVEHPLAGLAARAVIVVDEDGRVAYAQLVPEITEEPDYESALAVLK